MAHNIQSKRWLFFLLVATGVLVSTLDSSMINVALPSIMRTFSADLADTELVVLAYLATITIFLVFWGRLADTLGKRQVYLKGMLVFAVSSLGCYLSTSLNALILFRCLQGFGAAMMMSSGPAIIKMVFPAEQLGRGLGLIGLATSCGLMTGPVVSGFLIRYFSWRFIFLITVPLCILMSFLGHFYLIKNLQETRAALNTKHDWFGFFLWGVIVFLFVLLVSQADRLSGLSYGVAWVLLAGILMAFLWLEKRTADSLIPFTLFRERYFWIAVVTVGISFAVLFIVLLLIPFYLDHILQLSADRIGMVMLAVPITLIVVSPLSGWLYDHTGAKHLTTFGLAISCLATISLLSLGAGSERIDVMARLALLGAGQAMFLSPNSASVLSRVHEMYAGVAAGILATARNLGMLMGAGLSGLIFSFIYSIQSNGGGLHTFHPGQTAAFLLSLRWSLGLAAIFAAVGCLLSGLRER